MVTVVGAKPNQLTPGGASLPGAAKRLQLELEPSSGTAIVQVRVSAPAAALIS